LWLDLADAEVYRGGSCGERARAMPEPQKKEKPPLMVPNDLGPQFSRIPKPDPTQGQTIGKTPWDELQAAKPHMFDAESKYHGPGKFDPSTHEWFTFAYKGQADAKLDRSCYMVTEKLLSDLRSNAPHITVLDIDNRQLIDIEMLKIFEALETNTTVVELKLAHNDADESAVELAELLKTNRTITKVDISSNDMHDKAIRAWGAMLAVNATLKELNFANNFCRDDVKDIAAGLAVNKTLTKLNLNVSQIDDAGALKLKEALASNTTLRELTGYNNPIVDKELRKWMKTARAVA